MSHNQWSIAKIADIAAQKQYALNGGPFGSKLGTQDYQPEGVPVIRGSNLSLEGGFSLDDFVFVSDEKANELRPNLAHPGDLVFTQRGTLGQVGIIPKDCGYDRFIVSQSQMKLTVDESKADPYYVFLYFRSPSTIEAIKARGITSGVPHINLEILRNFEIPLPPLDTQHRIADILSAYDDLIANNSRRMALLEESMHLLYREWFVRLHFPGHEHTPIVDGVPAGWNIGPVKTIGEVVTGKTPSTSISEFYGDDVPFIKIPDMHGNIFITETVDCLSEMGAQSQGNKFIPPNSIIVSCIGTVGEVAITSKLSQTNQQINSIILDNTNYLHYSYFALRGKKAQLQALGSNGATMGNVNKGKFESMTLLLPAEDLLIKFSTICQPAFEQVLTLQLENQLLREARDLLLPRLMNGAIPL